MREQIQLSREIHIPVEGGAVRGSAVIPVRAHGLILLVHGSGSSRRAELDRHAAWQLQAAGFGTVSMDLLDEHEARFISNVFDAELQASRLIEAVQELRSDPAIASLAIGLLGTGTGAATALLAAAKEPACVRAIVSRGGRCDVAEFWLPRITVPTMLIVGDRDAAFHCNRDAYRRIPAQHKELVIIPGATHLFEEAGALQKASSCASRWFERHLGERKPSAEPEH